MLVFDRLLAEAIVKEIYPTEGPHYLEKIIQAGFDIPEPRQDDLRQELLGQIAEICGAPDEHGTIRFMNVFYDVVARGIRTPRDLIRLTNSLAVTWRAVGNDVDRADFIGLEVLRLLRPAVYQVLHSNKERLTTTTSPLSGWTREQRSQFDKVLLSDRHRGRSRALAAGAHASFPASCLGVEQCRLRRTFQGQWSRERRVCASDHFNSYFRFAISDDVLGKQEIDELVAHASDDAFLTAALRNGLAVKRSSGGTKAALIIDELNLHANSVADDCIQPLLTTMFRLCDELDVTVDEAKAFSIGNNHLRIHWLLRRLTFERFDLAHRSAIFMTACKNAALGWLVDFGVFGP